MVSERIEIMSNSWLYTVITLYLENPGIGEFPEDDIDKNLPSKHWLDNETVLFTRSDFNNATADIIRCLRERDVGIVRKFVGGKYYYKIVNIQEVIDRQNYANKSHFQQPMKFTELWAGSGIVGKQVG